MEEALDELSDPAALARVPSDHARTPVVIGVGMAFLTTKLVVAYAPDALPRLDELTIDARVLAFAMVSAGLTGLLFGIVPALQTSQPNDPSVPVYDVRPMNCSPTPWVRDASTCICWRASPLVALLLACIGLFSVMAYLVSQRMQDIGVRLALGAAPRDVLRLILDQGLGLTLAGTAIGVLAGLAGSGIMRTLLYSVTPTDAVTFVSVPLGLIAVALLACYVPARRAMKIDPLIALRSE